MPWTESDEGSVGLAPLSICVGLLIFTFYNGMSTYMQYAYYYFKAGNTKAWKIQSQRADHVGSAALLPWFPWLELLPWFRKSGRNRFHCILSTINTVVTSLCAAAVCELALRGHSRFYYHEVGGSSSVWEHVSTAPWLCIAGQLVVAVIHENVVEYYWHRLMHIRYFYVTMHKIHHSNKAPEPFDDMVIHPLEAFGYFCILYSPPFIYATHLYSFVLYMAIMGIAGITDHCGIRFQVPLLYDSADHDAHHSRTHVNFGFPFPWLDILHGTYDGTYLGRTYTVPTQPGKAKELGVEGDLHED